MQQCNKTIQCNQKQFNILMQNEKKMKKNIIYIYGWKKMRYKPFRMTLGQSELDISEMKKYLQMKLIARNQNTDLDDILSIIFFFLHETQKHVK